MYASFDLGVVCYAHASDPKSTAMRKLRVRNRLCCACLICSRLLSIHSCSLLWRYQDDRVTCNPVSIVSKVLACIALPLTNNISLCFVTVRTFSSSSSSSTTYTVSSTSPKTKLQCESYACVSSDQSPSVLPSRLGRVPLNIHAVFL
jgi:hypothetical protein